MPLRRGCGGSGDGRSSVRTRPGSVVACVSESEAELLTAWPHCHRRRVAGVRLVGERRRRTPTALLPPARGPAARRRPGSHGPSEEHQPQRGCSCVAGLPGHRRGQPIGWFSEHLGFVWFPSLCLPAQGVACIHPRELLLALLDVAKPRQPVIAADTYSRKTEPA